MDPIDRPPIIGNPGRPIDPPLVIDPPSIPIDPPIIVGPPIIDVPPVVVPTIDPDLIDRLKDKVPFDPVVVDSRPIDGITNPKLIDNIGKVITDRLPDGPLTRLPAGKVGQPIVLNPEEFSTLLRQVVIADGRRVVWNGDGGEVLVLLDTLKAGLVDGMIVVGLTLQTEETGQKELTVSFSVGSSKRDAGLMMATADLPDGDLTLARLWGEAVTATAWQAVLGLAVTVAATAGGDRFGQPLRPGAIWAAKQGFVVVPQAAHVLRQGKG